jgi:hypothetical protein
MDVLLAIFDAFDMLILAVSQNGIPHHPLTRKHPGHVDHPSLVW